MSATDYPTDPEKRHLMGAQDANSAVLSQVMDAVQLVLERQQVLAQWIQENRGHRSDLESDRSSVLSSQDVEEGERKPRRKRRRHKLQRFIAEMADGLRKTIHGFQACAVSNVQPNQELPDILRLNAEKETEIERVATVFKYMVLIPWTFSSGTHSQPTPHLDRQVSPQESGTMGGALAGPATRQSRTRMMIVSRFLQLVVLFTLLYSWAITCLPVSLPFFSKNNNTQPTETNSLLLTAATMDRPYRSVWPKILVAPQYLGAIFAAIYCFYYIELSNLQNLMRVTWTIHPSGGVTFRCSRCCGVTRDRNVLIIVIVIGTVFVLFKHSFWLWAYIRSFTANGHSFWDLTVWHQLNFALSSYFRAWKTGAEPIVYLWFSYCCTLLNRQLIAFGDKPDGNPRADTHSSETETLAIDEARENDIFQREFEGTKNATARLYHIKKEIRKLQQGSILLVLVMISELVAVIALVLQLTEKIEDIEKDWLLGLRTAFQNGINITCLLITTFTISRLNTTACLLPGKIRRCNTGRYLVYRLEPEVRDPDLQFHPFGIRLSGGSFFLIIITVVLGILTLSRVILQVVAKQQTLALYIAQNALMYNISHES